jgi:hypothetical protein
MAQGLPLTMACRYYPTDLTVNQTLMSIADTGANVDYYQMGCAGAVADDPIRCVFRSDVGDLEIVDSTSGAGGVSAWYHACCVFASTTSRSVYFDGGSKATGTDNVPEPAGIDTTTIGAIQTSTVGGYFDGSIAEAAVWSAALTDAEVATLAEGYSPLLVRPGSLVAYWPLIRDTDDDIVGGYSLTANGGPTIAVHPPVLYAAGEHIASLRVIPDAEIVWGHDTAVLEGTVRDFQYNWTGTGTVINGGVADTERIDLSAGEYMISEVVDTGAVNVEILYNVYTAGDTIDLDYRTGASRTACQAAAWNNYVSGFLSSGYVQIRVTSTL